MSAIDFNFKSDFINALNNKYKNKNRIMPENLAGFQTSPMQTFADGGLLANPDGLMFTEDEVANIVRANTNKGRKKRMEEAKENKKFFRGLLPESDGTLFAIGGDLQTHGSDWSTKAMHINAGGSHEENENDGVQIGTDSEGVPNLVEEGEIIYDDYVFSNRIELDDKAKEALHFPKKSELTYAEAAKKLEKEISERPNDAISIAGFKAQMEQLEEQQERQKQEMEAERAKEAFEALSPEEQTALMQQKAQQDAMEEQAAQEQAMAEAQAAQGQPSPEEMAAMEQQAAMQQQQMSPEEAAMMQQQTAAQQPIPEVAPVEQPVMAAEGGEINRFDRGGELRKKVYNLLGIQTDEQFAKWADENKLSDFLKTLWSSSEDNIDWDKALANEAFVDALTKDRPALAHAMKEDGYKLLADAAAASEEPTLKIGTDGQWDKRGFNSWYGKGNKEEWDAAFAELMEKAFKGKKPEDKDLPTEEEFARALAGTDAYKKTTEWLKTSPDNMLRYLNEVIKNSPSEGAVAHAKKYVGDDGKWKEGKVPTYDEVFGKVRGSQPGTYWKSALPALTKDVTRNYLINDDGSVGLIRTDVPEDWKLEGEPITWTADNTNYTNKYYRMPTSAADIVDKGTEGDGTKAAGAEGGQDTGEETPQYKFNDKKLKNLSNIGMGLYGIPLAMQLAGIGKPDTSGMDRVLANAARNYHTATAKYLGNYMKYKPMDTWFTQAKMDAQARATDRAIMDSGANQSAINAALLQNGANAITASGENLRADNMYNRSDEFKTNEYNKNTDLFNAQTYNQLSQFNTTQDNQAANTLAQLGFQVESAKDDANRWWNSNLYQQVGKGIEAFNKWVRNKTTDDLVARIWGSGIVPVSPNSPLASPHLAGRQTNAKPATSAVKGIGAEGGKVKKKKGKKRGLFI